VVRLESLERRGRGRHRDHLERVVPEGGREDTGSRFGRLYDEESGLVERPCRIHSFPI